MSKIDMSKVSIRELFEVRDGAIAEINKRMRKFLLTLQAAGEDIISFQFNIAAKRYNDTTSVKLNKVDFQLVENNIVDYGNYRNHSNERGEYTQEYPTFPIDLVENYTSKSLADYVANKKLAAMRASFRRDEEEELEDSERFDGQE